MRTRSAGIAPIGAKNTTPFDLEQGVGRFLHVNLFPAGSLVTRLSRHAPGAIAPDAFAPGSIAGFAALAAGQLRRSGLCACLPFTIGRFFFALLSPFLFLHRRWHDVLLGYLGKFEIGLFFLVENCGKQLNDFLLAQGSG